MNCGRWTVGWLVVSLVVSCAEATGNVQQCCRNNGSLTNNGLCDDNRPNIVKDMCRGRTAYILQPNVIPQDNFTVDPATGDLVVLASQWTIAKGDFCTSLLSNHSVALACFSETRSSAGIGAVATVICSVVSSSCLLVTLLVYCLLPKLRDLQGKCIMSLVASLFAAFIFLAIFQFPSVILDNAGLCLFMASMMYVLFLFVFFWLNVVSFNVWQSLIKPPWLRKFTSSPSRLWWWYCAWGWGAPLALLALTLVLHHAPWGHVPPGFAQAGLHCWFTSTLQIWLYFYGPVSALLFANLVLFVWSARRVWAGPTGRLTPRAHSSRSHRLALHVKLFVVMGVCWTFEPISSALQGYHLVWIVTDYVNALQGVAIFLLLVAFRRKTRVGLAQRLPLLARCCTPEEEDSELDSEDSSEDDVQRVDDLTREQPLTYNQLLK